jgi:nitrate reductase beta subunit
MWVIKCKGETHYVNHVDVKPGVGFSTKETPDNPKTKGSIKFKANITIEENDGVKTATIY